MMLTNFFKLLFVFAFFSSSPCFANWTFQKKYDDVSIYTSENKTRLVLTHKKTSKTNKHITERSIKSLEKSKKEMLSVAGIKKWKINKSHITKAKKVTQVELSGSYINSSEEKVYFKEHHFYSPSNNTQFLLTNSKKKLLKKDSTINNLSKFRKQYGI